MRSGTEDLRDLALDQLTWPGFLHLIANGHLSAGSKQTADIGSGGMERDATHGNGTPSGEGDIEQLRPGQRILKKHFVKISQPKKQQGILGQLAFDAAILRHHGSHLRLGGHVPEANQERSVNRRIFRGRKEKARQHLKEIGAPASGITAT